MTLVNGSTGEVVSGPLAGQLTTTGYVLPEGMPYDDWAAEGPVLLSMARSCMWWVGDWIRYGERAYGEKYAQAVEMTGLSYQTLANAAWVSGRFEAAQRRPGLSFEHHVRTAALDPSVRTELLGLAETNGLSAKDVANEVRRLKHQERVIDARSSEVENEAGDRHVIEDINAEPDIYRTIVVDPPWRYDNRATRNNAESVYKREEDREHTTMSQEELLKLHIPASDNSHLYLWVTNSFIRDGFELMEEWGFKYKTCLTWCKPQIGMGNYFRATTEHVLFGIRGKVPTLRNDVPTHFVADRGAHSAKPDSFYDLVETCSIGPFLDMFARRRRFRWYVWGNEA